MRVAPFCEPIGEEDERVPGQQLKALIDQLGVGVDPEQHPRLDLSTSPGLGPEAEADAPLLRATVVVGARNIELHEDRGHEALIGSLLEDGFVERS